MNWFYQLQDIDVDDVGAVQAAVKVIDRDDADGNPYDVGSIKVMQGHPQTKILSYLSIGEAEDYRAYWKRPTRDIPRWLEQENLDWPGNYKVRYWDPNWQEIIFKEVDKIIDQGFHGVYLDIIDAFEYFAEQGRSTADQEMITFVQRIAQHARFRRPNFWIVPQNGAALLTDLGYAKTINAIGMEDIFYGERGDAIANGWGNVGHTLLNLAQLAPFGSPVLAVEYGLSVPQKEEVRRLALKHGLRMYFTDRALDRVSPVEVIETLTA